MERQAKECHGGKNNAYRVVHGFSRPEAKRYKGVMIHSLRSKDETTPYWVLWVHAKPSDQMIDKA